MQRGRYTSGMRDAGARRFGEWGIPAIVARGLRSIVDYAVVFKPPYSKLSRSAQARLRGLLRARFGTMCLGGSGGSGGRPSTARSRLLASWKTFT